MIVSILSDAIGTRGYKKSEMQPQLAQLQKKKILANQFSSFKIKPSPNTKMWELQSGHAQL